MHESELLGQMLFACVLKRLEFERGPCVDERKDGCLKA